MRENVGLATCCMSKLPSSWMASVIRTLISSLSQRWTIRPHTVGTGARAVGMVGGGATEGSAWGGHATYGSDGKNTGKREGIHVLERIPARL